MLINKNGFRAYNEYDLSQTLEREFEKLTDEVKRRNLDENTEEELIKELIAQAKVSPLKFQEDEIAVDSEEQMIRSEHFPNSGFIVRRGESYPKNVYTFYLPFSGDSSLLRCVPNTRILWTEEIATEGENVIFQLIDFRNSTEDLKKERDRVIKFLKDQAVNVNSQVMAHNEKIEGFVRQKIEKEARKRENITNTINELGKPLNKVKKAEEKPRERLEQPTRHEEKQYDVFISHASEDKEFVDKLANRLQKEGLEVWYDTFIIDWGNDLRTTIDNGLKNSKYGIVVFSKSFLAKKKWTEYELNGLFARERNRVNVILPLWHDVSRSDVEEYSPSLSDRVALKSDDLDKIAKEMMTKIKRVA